MRRLVPVLFLAATAAVPAVAEAFCGFYVAGADAQLFNNATQVVLMREGTRTVMSMQNNYQGPAEDFAMVVPVPAVLQEENVKTLPASIFARVDALSSPRLVEYWEQDPCWRPRPRRMRAKSMARRSAMPAAEGAAAPRDYGVTVEAQFAVGEYEIVILSAEDSLGLYDWLKDNRYKIPDGAERVLRPYVSSGMKFFVAKVDIDKVTYDASGRTMLSPLRFHYDSDVFNLPVRLGLLNSRGTQDLIVYILARNQRYEVANYENVTIPTNLHVRKRTRQRFGSFYASLFDRTLRQNRGAVVTEYSWQAMKCDPCPGPSAALTGQELATLGADVIDGAGQIATPRPGGPQGRRVRRPVMVRGGEFVLTRLHTRYGKRSLGEDLIFKAAPPLAGGREVRNANGRLEKGAQSAGTNTFQARYIIRHRWRGKVTCQNPQWGRWGGPPPQVLARRKGNSGPSVATDLGLLKQRKVRLSRFLLQSVPELGLRWRPREKKKAD